MSNSHQNSGALSLFFCFLALVNLAQFPASNLSRFAQKQVVTAITAMPPAEIKMSNGVETNSGSQKPELHMLYRPLAIRAVAAAALMIKGKTALKPGVKPA
jgi:hypothetical protein